MAGVDLGQVLTDQLVQAAKVVEEQLDQEMDKLEKMDEDELEILKQKRIQMMKKQQEKKQEWLKNGHGEYSEIPEERDFFNVTRSSENVVIHFYRDETFRCKILDKHLAILAKKHVETKFCKINASKCPFLCNRLRINVIPTMGVFKDAKTRDFIVGFTDLGNHDEFSTEMLEWRLAHTEVINYSGDLNTPPDAAAGGPGKVKGKTTFIGKPKAKPIRGQKDDGDSSDDNDW